MEPISSVGWGRLRAYGAILVCNLIVLILSAKVNVFQEFFFAADVFPFVLSIITFILMITMLAIDLMSRKAPSARPARELGWLGFLTLLWLCFNAFSSSRWQGIGTSSCGAIPAGFEAERAWCRELVALRAFVWIEWVIFLLTFAFLLHYVITNRESHRWNTSLSRYDPTKNRFNRNSEFVQTPQVDLVQWRS